MREQSEYLMFQPMQLSNKNSIAPAYYSLLNIFHFKCQFYIFVLTDKNKPGHTVVVRAAYSLVINYWGTWVGLTFTGIP